MNERMLPELMPGDLFATPPGDPLARFAADVMNADTFHWGVVVHPFLTEAGIDYEIMEAIPSKGVAVGLLSKMYGDIPIRIYQVKAAIRPSEEDIERIADAYGRTSYGFSTLPGLILWWLRFNFLRFLGSEPPALGLTSAVCTSFVTMLWRDLGVDLVPQGTSPTQDMLERSQNLECIYNEF